MRQETSLLDEFPQPLRCRQVHSTHTGQDRAEGGRESKDLTQSKKKMLSCSPDLQRGRAAQGSL